jgi:hypothetical protein
VLLREGIAGGDRLLSLRDIYAELMRSLRLRRMPAPQHLGTGLADLIALGRNAAGAAPTTAQPIPKVTEPEVDRSGLEKEFQLALIRGYQRAKRELNYNASIYISMISQHGGVGAVRRLITSPAVSSGFTTLWEKGRLDLTVEAFILQERWYPLFTDEERDIARARLAEYGCRI